MFGKCLKISFADISLQVDEGMVASGSFSWEGSTTVLARSGVNQRLMHQLYLTCGDKLNKPTDQSTDTSTKQNLNKKIKIKQIKGNDYSKSYVAIGTQTTSVCKG